MTPIILSLPPSRRWQALRNAITTTIYRARAEAARKGLDVRQVILSWAPR